jgi:hypothetical protein
MMIYSTWMAETKRGALTPRSKLLKAIDGTFEAFQRTPQPDQKLALARALKAWLDSKGTAWKQSERNSTKVSGKGTVERLVDDLSADPQCRTVLGPYATPLPAKSDYQALLDFIGAQTRGATMGPGESYRDLGALFTEKRNQPGNDADDVDVMKERALRVAGLSGTGSSTLELPANAHKRACAAVVMAMSIIRDTDEDDLVVDYRRLLGMQTTLVLAELLSIVKKGDVIQSARHPKLQLKNFGSAGKRGPLWRSEIEDAYARTHQLLLQCEMQFLYRRSPLSGKIATAFTDFFGDPAATINAATIPLTAGRKPNWAPGNLARVEVVRAVLRKVCQNFVRQNVRIYLGGRSIDSGTFAYVSGTTNPTKIHVGGQFFTKGKLGLGSEAGTIIHECTHTFGGTKDHKYRPEPCKGLVATTPEKALSNADSYKFFVEAAFG